MRNLLLIAYFISISSIFAQSTIYKTQIFDPQIKSVQMVRPDWKLTYSVIHLNSNEHLQLIFDDLSGDTRDFNYNIEYCNADWTPSDLMKSDYLEGFDEQPLQDFSFSSNTTQKYVHYFLTIPNQDVQLLLPGNYILKIYKNNHPDELILTHRFYVVDEKLTTQALIKRPVLSQYNLTHQQVNVFVYDNNNLISNPYQDLTVVIKQNNRDDRSLSLNAPRYVEVNELIYDDEQKNIFPGGNEFYHFDTKNIRFKEMRTDSIRYDGEHYQFFIQPDELLPYRAYESRPDLNGQFYIKLESQEQSSIYADYVEVYLSAENNKHLMEGELYVVGDFNFWQTSPQYRLPYDPQSSTFCTKLYVKQGYYNYSYKLISPKGEKDIIDNHTETENDYLIFVYLKDRTLGNDLLVSFAIYNSIKGEYDQ